jgi:hypothetical protein
MNATIMTAIWLHKISEVDPMKETTIFLAFVTPRNHGLMSSVLMRKELYRGIFEALTNHRRLMTHF